MLSRKRTLVTALTLLAGSAAGVLAVACGDDDPAPAKALEDASPPSKTDADPCDSYTGVGKACGLQPGRICFSQCTTGGCFCENGVWACRTDTSCFRDGDVVDVVTPPVDAEVDAEVDASLDASTDADGSTDADLDAPDGAPDAISDAPTDG